MRHLMVSGLLVLLSASVASAQSSPTLQITSPSALTSVIPGQSISVTVNGTPGVSYSEVFIRGETPLGNSTSSQSGTPPFQFSLPIPAAVVHGLTDF